MGSTSRFGEIQTGPRLTALRSCCELLKLAIVRVRTLLPALSWRLILRTGLASPAHWSEWGVGMAHTVKFALPPRQLGHADIEFLVLKNGRVFGKLLVSKGAIVWRRKWKSKRGRNSGGQEFDKAMEERGRSV